MCVVQNFGTARTKSRDSSSNNAVQQSATSNCSEESSRTMPLLCLTLRSQPGEPAVYVLEDLGVRAIWFIVRPWALSVSIGGRLFFAV